MLTEEEFTVFQNQLVDVGQENFALRERLDDLKEENKELSQLKIEYDQWKNKLEEMKERHTQTLEILNYELQNLQHEAATKQESNTKLMQEKVNDLNSQIQEINKNTVEKQHQVEELRAQIKNHQHHNQEKQATINQLRIEASKYLPIMKFLYNARGLPMYLEDLQGKIASLTAARNKDIIDLGNLDQHVTDLHRKNDDLGRKIKEHTQMIEETQADMEDIKRKTIQAETETSEAELSFQNSEERIQKAIEANQQKEKDTEAELSRISDGRKSLDKELQEQEQKKEEIQNHISQLKKKTDVELAKYSDKIAMLRHKLNVIKETGYDEDTPRVDRDLQDQINRIVQEKMEIYDKTEMLRQAKKLVEDDIRDKDFQIQTLVCRMPPTEAVINAPEFHEKQALLEELVLQNRELRATVSDMTEKIVQMREEAVKIRQAITDKTAQ